MSTQASGFFPRLRAAFWGQRDPVAERIKRIEKQGAGPARMAHFLAVVLIVLTSIYSFLALGQDDAKQLVASWQHGQLDILAALFTATSFVFVAAMDGAMVIGALNIRVVISRLGGIGQMLHHIGTVVIVAILEAGTYLDTSWTYDKPVTLGAQLLIIGRAVVMPGLAVYLSLADHIPATADDILRENALASGIGVIKDTTGIAADSSVPTHHKVAIFRASSVMSKGARERLDGLVTATQAVQSTRLTPSEWVEPDLPPDGGRKPSAHTGTVTDIVPFQGVPAHSYSSNDLSAFSGDSPVDDTGVSAQATSAAAGVSSGTTQTLKAQGKRSPRAAAGTQGRKTFVGKAAKALLEKRVESAANILMLEPLIEKRALARRVDCSMKALDNVMMLLSIRRPDVVALVEDARREQGALKRASGEE
jgi:hypothetical protein